MALSRLLVVVPVVMHLAEHFGHALGLGGRDVVVVAAVEDVDGLMLEVVRQGDGVARFATATDHFLHR